MNKASHFQSINGLPVLVQIFFQYLVFGSLSSIAQQDSLRGKVSVVKAYSISTLGDSLLIIQKYFDQNGNLVEHNMFNNTGEMVKTQKNKFSKQNLKTEDAEYDANGKLHGKTTYQYNNRGDLIEKVRYETEDEWEYKISYSYDKSGNKTAEIKTSEEGTLMKKKIFNHDINGNVTEEKNYNAKDSLEVWYTRQYDARNNLIEEIRYLRSSEQWRVNFTFNKDNKKESEMHCYRFEKSNNSTVWHYDDSQRLIGQVLFDYKHKIMQRSSFTYMNEKLIEEEKNNSITKFEYALSGNKTKEKVYAGRVPIIEKSFDLKGNIVGLITYTKGTVSFSESFIYDSSNTYLTHKIKKDALDVIQEESEYRYDAKGNITDEVDKGMEGKVFLKKATVYRYY